MTTCRICPLTATVRVAFKGNTAAEIEPHVAPFCRAHGEAQRVEPDFSWLEDLKPSVRLDDSVPAMVQVFRAQWTVWTPIAEGEGGSYYETHTCTHNHRTRKAANDCGRDQAERARRALHATP